MIKKAAKFLGRFVLYLLLTACVAVTVLSGMCTWFLAEREFYQGNDEAMQEVMLVNEEQAAEEIGRKLLYLYLFSGQESVNIYCEGTNILYSLVHFSRPESGRRIAGNLPIGMEKEAYSFRYKNSFIYLGRRVDAQKYMVKVSFDKVGTFLVPYNAYVRTYGLVIRYRYFFPVIFVLGLVVSIFMFFLVTGNRRSGTLLCRVPLELVLAGAVGSGYLLYQLIYRLGWTEVTIVLPWNGVVLVASLVGSLFGAHLIVRLRMKYWYRNTLVYRIYYLWRRVYRHLPVIRRLVLTVAGISVAEGAAILLFTAPGKGRWILLGFWLAEKLFLLPVLFYHVLTLKNIRGAAERLADGDLAYKLDTEHLHGTMLGFAKDMNSISNSVSVAVEDRMKSERLKTELITNVSHDIKTPLTSIINFADLIHREETENPKITEYAGLLHKQSSRLKKLIEDLIEASKASTGNMEINIEPCEVRTLLAQCLGEYEQRLQDLNIELIVKLGQEPTWILADPKVLWRIFENLMSNICKYTQTETRVYLSMERKEESVTITFKNISKYQLDISPEELTERFVRGDLSRHTEGNGLGLSIVKNLMDLQNGKIELAVDGDLFKAILEFPRVEHEEPAIEVEPVMQEEAEKPEPEAEKSESETREEAENVKVIGQEVVEMKRKTGKRKTRKSGEGAAETGNDTPTEKKYV